MKKLVFLSAIVLAFSISSKAQFSITVSETTENFGKTSHNAFSVIIHQQTLKNVEREWAKYMKDQRGKVRSKKGLITAHNVALYQISSDTVNAYARFSKTGEDQVKAAIGFESGASFVSSAEGDDRYDASRKIVYDFAVRMSKEGVVDNIQQAEKDLKKLERETSILEKDKSRLEYGIEKSKASITKAGEEIDKKNIKLEENKLKLEEKNKQVSDLNESLRTIE